jgi:hypothetical protein
MGSLLGLGLAAMLGDPTVHGVVVDAQVTRDLGNDLSVSTTIRTAPARNSGSYWRLVLATT